MQSTMERVKRPAQTKKGVGNQYKLEEYLAKYQNYQFRIDWTSSEPFNPEDESVDVRLKVQDGSEYWANFATIKFIARMFEKNKRTGECSSGIYFCMPGMIVVEKIDEETVRATIDDIIKNYEVEKYFERKD